MIGIKFKGVAEIQKYYQEQLNKGNTKAFKDIKAKSGESFEVATDKMLIAEAKRLHGCIQARIEEYYDSYTPKFYKRTNGLRNALKVETSVQQGTNGKYIGLYFEDSLSWGQSVVTGLWDGWKPGLIESGWKNKSYSDPHFLGYQGFDFINKGIEDWKKDLKNPVEVKRIDFAW